MPCPLSPTTLCAASLPASVLELLQDPTTRQVLLATVAAMLADEGESREDTGGSIDAPVIAPTPSPGWKARQH